MESPLGIDFLFAPGHGSPPRSLSHLDKNTVLGVFTRSHQDTPLSAFLKTNSLHRVSPL